MSLSGSKANMWRHRCGVCWFAGASPAKMVLFFERPKLQERFWYAHHLLPTTSHKRQCSFKPTLNVDIREEFPTGSLAEVSRPVAKPLPSSFLSLESAQLSKSPTSTFKLSPLLRDKNSISSNMCNLDQESMAEKELDEMLQKTDAPAQKPVDRAFLVQSSKLRRLLMKVNCHSSILPTLKQFLFDGNTLPKNVAVNAITSLKREQRYRQALEIADFAWREGLYEIDEYDHTYRLYLTGQTSSIEDVEKCFDGIPLEWQTEIVYNQLISAYRSRGMIAEAEATLEKLKNSGRLVSALPYNQLIALYKHMRQPDKVLQLLEDMKASSIILPNTKSYNIVLSLLLKQGCIDKAIKVFNTMKESGTAPDVLTYSLAAKAYVAAGMIEEMGDLVTEMKKISPKNCHLTHDLLLSIYAEQGNYEEMQKLWKHICGLSKPSARSYGVMIESLGKLGLVHEAEQLATEAERMNGALILRVFNALMYVYARHAERKKAESLMARIRQARLRPSSPTYKYLISVYLQAGDLEKALLNLKLSRESLTYDSSKPWFETFMMVLEYVVEKCDIETAEWAFEKFTTEGHYRCTAAYNLLLKAYMKAGKPAGNFIDRMSKDSAQPDAETLAMLAEIEGRACVHVSVQSKLCPTKKGQSDLDTSMAEYEEDSGKVTRNATSKLNTSMKAILQLLQSDKNS